MMKSIQAGGVEIEIPSKNQDEKQGKKQSFTHDLHLAVFEKSLVVRFRQ